MQIQIRTPDDFHTHFRDGAMMQAVVPYTAAHFARALVMPNVPVIEDAEEAFEYFRRIKRAAHEGGQSNFHPLMTLKLTSRTTATLIEGASRHTNIKACKLYPTGATTASHDGISNVESLAPVLAEMQRVGMVLCIHGEEPSAFVMDREKAYLGKVAWIVRNFPGLKVVLEHITTADAVEFVEAASVNVAATITVHHLMTTLDDVLGNGIRPHLFCYPVPKRIEDRSALRWVARNDQTGRFFFGSDSAPHLKGAKESACGCAGVFSAPTALATLAEFFFDDPFGYRGYPTDDQERRAAFERFTSINGAKFYGLPLNEGTVTLEQSPWEVPGEIGGVVPFRAGETLPWQVTGRSS